MLCEFFNLDDEWLGNDADAVLDHVRRLGPNDNLIMANANLGAYEALLALVAGAEGGTPAYQALTNVKSRNTSQSGILARLNSMRALDLIEGLPGPKRSQVCLAPVLLERVGSGK
jgi:hypothetical protein